MENTTVGNKRNITIDVMKGIGIIFVVFYHLFGIGVVKDITVVDPSITNPNSLNDFIFNFGSGLLGMFIFLAGYLYTSRGNILKDIKHRTLTLLIPGLLFMIIVCFITFIYETSIGNNPGINTYLYELFKRLTGDSFVNYYDYIDNYKAPVIRLVLIPSWFIIRLYVSSLIFILLVRFSNKKLIYCIISIISLLIICSITIHFLGFILPMDLQTCIGMTSIMLLGAYLKKCNVIEKIEKGYMSYKYWLISLLFLLLFFLSNKYLYIYKGQSIFYNIFDCVNYTSIEGPFLWFICNVITIYVFIFVSMWIGKIPYISKVLTQVGKSSSYILVFHVILSFIIIRLINPSYNIELTICETYNSNVVTPDSARLLVAFISITLCTLLSFGSRTVSKLIKRKKKNN